MRMNENIKKTRVGLDNFYSLDISVNESKRTVIAELVACGEEPEFIYAEKFDAPCNYLRTAIKKAISYIGTINELQVRENKKRSKDDSLYAYASYIVM